MLVDCGKELPEGRGAVVHVGCRIEPQGGRGEGVLPWPKEVRALGF